MSASPRIQSFADFWPYYIGEHRQPLCRVLHFVGTGGFMSVLVACLAINPARMSVCLFAGFCGRVCASWRVWARARAHVCLFVCVYSFFFNFSFCDCGLAFLGEAWIFCARGGSAF